MLFTGLKVRLQPYIHAYLHIYIHTYIRSINTWHLAWTQGIQMPRQSVQDDYLIYNLINNHQEVVSLSSPRSKSWDVFKCKSVIAGNTSRIRKWNREGKTDKKACYYKGWLSLILLRNSRKQCGTHAIDWAIPPKGQKNLVVQILTPISRSLGPFSGALKSLAL